MNISILILSTFITGLITWLIVPKMRDLGLRFNLIDPPDKRKEHKQPVVRLGGVAILLGFFIGYAVLIGIGSEEIAATLKTYQIQTILLGGFLFFLLGLTDDLLNLSPLIRLIIQIVLSIYICQKGVLLESIDFSIGNYQVPLIIIPNEIQMILTVILIVGITNAINWIDGLDGLAAGITVISSIGFLCIGITNKNIYCCIIASKLIGSCLAFLKYNKFPSIILMGDGGSYFIGYILSILAISSLSDINTYSNIKLHASSLLIVSLPLFDMALVIFSRIKKGKSPFYPDRRHAHHRLMNLGYSHKSAVRILYIYTCWFTSIAFLYSLREIKIIEFLIGSILISLISLSLLKYCNRFKRLVI